MHGSERRCIYDAASLPGKSGTQQEPTGPSSAASSGITMFGVNLTDTLGSDLAVVLVGIACCTTLVFVCACVCCGLLRASRRQQANARRRHAKRAVLARKVLVGKSNTGGRKPSGGHGEDGGDASDRRHSGQKRAPRTDADRVKHCVPVHERAQETPGAGTKASIVAEKPVFGSDATVDAPRDQPASSTPTSDITGTSRPLSHAHGSRPASATRVDGDGRGGVSSPAPRSARAGGRHLQHPGSTESHSSQSDSGRNNHRPAERTHGAATGNVRGQGTGQQATAVQGSSWRPGPHMQQRAQFGYGGGGPMYLPPHGAGMPSGNPQPWPQAPGVGIAGVGGSFYGGPASYPPHPQYGSAAHLHRPW